MGSFIRLVVGVGFSLRVTVPEGSRVKNRDARLLYTVGCLRTPKKALNALLSGIVLLWQSIVYRSLFLCPHSGRRTGPSSSTTKTVPPHGSSCIGESWTTSITHACHLLARR